MKSGGLSLAPDFSLELNGARSCSTSSVYLDYTDILFMRGFLHSLVSLNGESKSPYTA